MRRIGGCHIVWTYLACYDGVTLKGDVGTPARNFKNGGAAAKSEKQTGVSASHYRVEKMKFAKTRDPETNKVINDKTTVIYNAHITVTGIPLEAYAYVVNGKPAIEWVMERQSVSKDKDSGIINDANLWATETMGESAYPLNPLNLLLRVITVIMETTKFVNGLPKLDI